MAPTRLTLSPASIAGFCPALKSWWERTICPSVMEMRFVGDASGETADRDEAIRVSKLLEQGHAARHLVLELPVLVGQRCGHRDQFQLLAPPPR